MPRPPRRSRMSCRCRLRRGRPARHRRFASEPGRAGAAPALSVGRASTARAVRRPAREACRAAAARGGAVEQSALESRAARGSCSAARRCRRPTRRLRGRERKEVACCSSCATRSPFRAASAKACSTSRRVKRDWSRVSPCGPSRRRASCSAAKLVARDPPRRLREHPTKPKAVEPVLRRASSPLVAEPVSRDVVLLAPARLQRGDLRRPGGSLSARGHVRQDLGAALREVLDHVARHAGNVRRPVLDRVPTNVEPLRQLCTQNATGRGTPQSSRAGRAAGRAAPSSGRHRRASRSPPRRACAATDPRPARRDGGTPQR